MPPRRSRPWPVLDGRELVHDVEQHAFSWNAGRGPRLGGLARDGRQAPDRTSSSTPSIENSFWYCLMRAFFGSMRIWISTGLVEFLQGGDDGQTTDQFGDQAER